MYQCKNIRTIDIEYHYTNMTTSMKTMQTKHWTLSFLQLSGLNSTSCVLDRRKETVIPECVLFLSEERFMNRIASGL